MTSALAAAFRRIFPVLTLLLALAVPGAAAFAWQAGYGAGTVLALLLGGTFAFVAVFGFLALQIETADRLVRLAAGGQPRRPASPVAVEEPSGAVGGMNPAPVTAAHGPVRPQDRRGAGPERGGRVEPMLTAARR
jgi:hypothetical protein